AGDVVVCADPFREEP
ncbi:hypothetical protein A483_HHAL011793, partial [Halyomorpha halys]